MDSHDRDPQAPSPKCLNVSIGLVSVLTATILWWLVWTFLTDATIRAESWFVLAVASLSGLGWLMTTVGLRLCFGWTARGGGLFSPAALFLLGSGFCALATVGFFGVTPGDSKAHFVHLAQVGLIGAGALTLAVKRWFALKTERDESRS